MIRLGHRSTGPQIEGHLLLGDATPGRPWESGTHEYLLGADGLRLRAESSRRPGIAP